MLVMSSLMKSGVSIIEGLKVTSQALDNTFYRQLLNKTAEQVKLGKPLTECLGQIEQVDIVDIR